MCIGEIYRDSLNQVAAAKWRPRVRSGRESSDVTVQHTACSFFSSSEDKIHDVDEVCSTDKPTLKLGLTPHWGIFDIFRPAAGNQSSWSRRMRQNRAEVQGVMEAIRLSMGPAASSMFESRNLHMKLQSLLTFRKL